MSIGDQLIDIVYIDDVVSACVTAANRLFDQKVTRHERFSVSSGAPIRLRDLAELYQQVTGQKLNIVWGQRPNREREVMVPWVQGELVPGWKPLVELEKGIKNLSNWK